MAFAGSSWYLSREFMLVDRIAPQHPHLLAGDREHFMERLAALPLSKSVEIAYKSIRVRFFRSMVTTASLVLAVAFLCYVQVVNNIATSLLQSGDPEALRALSRAGYDINGVTSIGESAQQQWLVALSLLVCVVGIINAQLMAVSERFREIGTMKCLGALDRVIMLLFLLEAGMQGLAGSLIGVLVGVLAGVASSAISLGAMVFASLPLAALAATGLQSVLVGCLLSLIGVLYPAIAAARMEPVEAMRVEQ